MHDQDDKTHDNRGRQDSVGNGDIEDCNKRDPDNIEDGDHDADALRTEPIEPAKGKLAFLFAGRRLTPGRKRRQCLRII